MRPQLLLAAFTALVSASCYSPGDGQAPPLDKLYFPTGLAIDTSSVTEVPNGLSTPNYLYAASSDFDLQYRSSGLISFDLREIVEKIPRPCAEAKDCQTDVERCDTLADAKANLGDDLGDYVPSYVCVPKGASDPCGGAANVQDPADRILYPGRCRSFDQHPFIHSLVGIGAFATDVLFASSPEGQAGAKARLFLPVRGDATLHWIDLEDGNLRCDQGQTDDDSCASSHRAGHDPSQSNNNIYQPSEPFGIDITDDGGYVAVTNQTSGSVSLYQHDWASAAGPQLVSIVGGLPAAPVAVAAVPQILDPTNAFAPAPGFLVAYRNAAQIDLLRVRNDVADGHPGGNYDRYTLTYAGSAGITINSLGYDSRDIVIDDRKRKELCEEIDSVADAASYSACLLHGPQPDVYVANRAPASLVIGSLTADPSYASGGNDLPSFNESIPLTTGPSRLVRGSVRVTPSGAMKPKSTRNLTDERGQPYDLEPRVFIVTFDSTRIFVYDPTRHAIDSIIDTGRGPYSIAIDEARGLAYVGFFTDSYLGVVSLDQRYPQTYANVIANIGAPTPPRTSK